MTPLAVPVPLLRKEARALAPIFLAAVAAMWMTVEMTLWTLSPLVFAVGAAALGAWSIGHELAHRTLAMLLAQPVSRSMIWRAKALVLGLSLALLTVVAAVLLREGMTWLLDGRQNWQMAILILTPLLGFCVAPALTMACRSALAGLVFTLAIPAVLWTTGQVLRAARAGFDVPLFEYEPALVLMAGGLTAASAVGLAWAWARFLRLQTLDAPVGLPPAVSTWRVRLAPARPATAAAARGRRSPLVALLRKELRLQPMAFLIAGLFCVKWMVLSLTDAHLAFAGQSFELLAWLYGGVVATIVGASASAEERALGTRDWQLLQPYAYWKQWLVKVAIVVMLALLLGVWLPAGLEWALPIIRDSGQASARLIGGFVLPPGVSRQMAVVGSLAMLSLYVSTLSTGTVRALLAVMLISSVWSLLYTRVFIATFTVERFAWSVLFGEGVWSPVWWRSVPTATATDYAWAVAVSAWAGPLAVGGFLLLALSLAARNHRFTGPTRATVVRQLIVLTLYVVAGSALVRLWPTLTLWVLVTR